MPAQPVPMEVMLARSSNGKTLGGRELEINDTSKMAPVKAPPMPDGLAERGRSEWCKIWNSGKWLWPEQDYAWVEQIARSYDLIDMFREQIAEDGPMVPGYRPGMMVAHPLFAEIKRAEATIQKCLSQIGFSPTDRARLKLVEAQGDVELSKLTRMHSDALEEPGETVQAYVEGEW